MVTKEQLAEVKALVKEANQKLVEVAEVYQKLKKLDASPVYSSRGDDNSGRRYINCTLRIG